MEKLLISVDPRGDLHVRIRREWDLPNEIPDLVEWWLHILSTKTTEED
jgi:hypothetical protein